MSYSRQIQYKMIPDESFRIIRNCSGCGGKAVFKNTGCFRVNANGRKIDIWLIYQCVKCKHTSNLSIYERTNLETVPKNERDAFMGNSSELALKYGTDAQFFSRNRAEIDWADISYSFRMGSDALQKESDIYEKGDQIVISNPCMLKVRKDKIASELLRVPRSRIKELEKFGFLSLKEHKWQHKIIIDFIDDIDVSSCMIRDSYI